MMRLYRVRTKRGAAELALRQLVGSLLTVTEALALEGSGWDGGLDLVRGGDQPWS
ncbi:MAG: hypothetical protein NVS3B24_18110 [Candidatus Dormibacteria bacterium]